MSTVKNIFTEKDGMFSDNKGATVTLIIFDRIVDRVRLSDFINVIINK